MRRKNQKRRRNRHIILLFIFVLLTIIAIIVFNVFYKQEKNDNSNIDNKENITTAIVEEAKVDNNTEENSVTNYEPDEHKTIQYDGDDPNTLDLLTGAITYSEISGDKLIIRLNIDQYLTNGTCHLSIKQNGKEQYSDTANIIETASSSTCEGFDVLIDNLVSGEATINIQLISDDKKGSLSRVVNI